MAAIRRAGEKKGVDTPLVLSTVVNTTTTNGDCFILNLIQAGAGSWNRIGRKVNLSSIRIRVLAKFRFAPVAATANQLANTLRMVLVWDRQPSGGAIPTFDAVFGKTAQDGTESTTFLDPLKYDVMDRYQVLRDTVVSKHAPAFNTGGSTNQNIVECVIDEYVKLNHEVIFSGQSTPMTIADINTGALYLFFRSNEDTSTTAQIAIDADSMARLRYTDL